MSTYTPTNQNYSPMFYYLVYDCDFNRKWYPEMIGNTYPYPPDFALVRIVPAGNA